MSDKTVEQELLVVLTKYRKKVVHQLKLLDEMIPTIRDITKMPESPQISVTVSQKPTEGPQAVIDRLLKNSPGRWFRPKDAAEEAMKRGYKPKNPKSWTTQTIVCLQRAKKKGIAQMREIEGKKEYALKDENEPQ